MHDLICNQQAGREVVQLPQVTYCACTCLHEHLDGGGEQRHVSCTVDPIGVTLAPTFSHNEGIQRAAQGCVVVIDVARAA